PRESNALDICFEADAPGALDGAAFAAGRNEVRMTIDPAAVTHFAETWIIPLHFAFDAPSGSVRLLSCGLSGVPSR
ncbi:MAG TPA: hypothetical protein VKU03_06510, partial [Roseiarcus sp.]|nr:hypothetical protein [Roseiarcus sp.]